MGLFVPAEYFEHGIIWEIENFSNLRLMSQSDQVSQFGSELSSMNRILNKKRSTSMRPSLYIIDNWGQGTLIGRTPTVWLGWIPGLYRIFYFENFAQILKSRKLRQYAWVFCSQSHYAGHFDMRNRIFWSRSQVCPRMPTYSNAHAKIKKVDFRGSVRRKLVRVWYHCKLFLKLCNLSYSDFRFKNPKIPGIQPTYDFLALWFRWKTI